MKSEGLFTRETINKVMQTITAGYVMFLIIAIPLFYHNQYYDIGNFKNALFYKGTILMLAFAVLGGILCLIERIFHKEHRIQRGYIRDKSDFWTRIKELSAAFSTLDIVALTYSVISIVSYLLSDYKSEALWGCAGWKMGLAAQLIFVFLYFLVSRFWNPEWNRLFVWVNCVASGIVFLLAILHRFTIDPLGLYEGIESYYFIEFLTTVGQATWYSSYLCTLLPIGVLLFWYCDGLWNRILLGIYCFLGFASLVTQNSDSAFVALGVMFVGLFALCFSVNFIEKPIRQERSRLDGVKEWKKNEVWKRLLEVLLLCLFSMRLVGILQLAFPERVVPLQPLSLFFSQNQDMWIVLTVVVIVYVFLLSYNYINTQENEKSIRIKKNKNTKIKSESTQLKSKNGETTKLIYGVADQQISAQKSNWFCPCFLFAIALSLFVIIFLMYLTTTNQLPTWLSFLNQIDYFHFNDDWGNARGFTWKLSAQMYENFSLREKLFGCGPDMYSEYMKAHYNAEMTARFGDSVLPNAHNEWFNMLICEGIFGLLAYLGFFVTAVVSALRGKRNIVCMIAAVCVLCYMGHNFFCYQQIMCTPFIFVIIGTSRKMSEKVDK